MPTIMIHGLIMDLDIHYAESVPSTKHANGYSELEWTCSAMRDELGENISRASIDLICKEYQSEIERAIWAQIEGHRS